MPRRKDISLALDFTWNGQFEISEGQFEDIRKAGYLNELPGRLRTRIDQACFWYIVCSGAEQNGSAINEQISHLEKALSSILYLRTFFKEMKNHAIFKARFHASKELSPSLSNFVNGEPWELPKDFFLWEQALKTALEKLKCKRPKDKGGRDINQAENAFKVSLRAVYDDAPGKKGAFENFYMAIAKTLPLGRQPDLDKQVGSITRQARRSRKNISTSSKQKRKAI